MTIAATIYDSFSRPVARIPCADVAHIASQSIFESYSDYPADLPESVPGPVASAMGAWLARARQGFDRWCESTAQQRADARLWDIARSDPRIMAELMHARLRDEREAVSEPLAAPLPAAALVEAAPVAQPPRLRVDRQGWGRVIQDAYQNRFHQQRPQHA